MGLVMMMREWDDNDEMNLHTEELLRVCGCATRILITNGIHVHSHFDNNFAALTADWIGVDWILYLKLINKYRKTTQFN